MTEPRRAVETAACFIAAATFSLLLCVAVTADDSQIRQRHQDQQETAAIARQLIADVLDIQLAQFSENGLDKLPVLHDVIQMRANLDLVAERDIGTIIDLLQQAQQVDGDRQATLLREARGRAREVVAVLMAERERLRQRLKVARLNAQLKQLFEKQRRVRTDTRQLHETAKDQRDQATLSALEDQRDAHMLYGRLLTSLDAVRQWDNREGKAASESMAQLLDNHVDRLFTNAETYLSQGDINSADNVQTEILHHLSAALEMVEAARGLSRFERSSALDKVDELLALQRQVMQDTQSVDAADQRQLDELSQRQHDVRQELGELDAPTSAVTEAQQALRDAKSAARQAESELFQGKSAAAVAEQHEVVRRLMQIRSVLEAAELATTGADAADDLRSRIDLLEQLDQALEELARQQDQIVADAAPAPARAERNQQSVVGALRQENERPQLPAPVQESVQAAATQAGQAAQIMQDHSPQGSAARTSAAQKVQESLAAARAETIAQLQAAHSQLQQTGALASAQMPPAQPHSASPPTPPSSPSAERGNQPRPVDSRQADPHALDSQRTVGDGPRADGDSRQIGSRSFADAPWFARLPPELREAIRMRGRQPPPRGYEDRLRRYFESVDK